MSEVNLVLEKFLHVMPLLGAMFSADIGVAVTDREKYLLYKSGRQLEPEDHRRHAAQTRHGHRTGDE